MIAAAATSPSSPPDLDGALRTLFPRSLQPPALADDEILRALGGAPSEDVLAALRRMEPHPSLLEFRLVVTEALLRDAPARMHAEAEHARNAVRMLVHDSSNLLSAVCGNLEFVERLAAQFPDQVREALVDAAEAGRSLQDLMSRTGDLMAVEQGRLMPARWVKLDAFLRAMKLPRSVVTELPAATFQLHARDAVLARTVRFLCQRAEAAGGATLKLAQVPGGISIVVTDTGPAVPEAVLSSMQTRSWRGENAEGIRAERTHGYHLAVLVARAHGGTCTFRSDGSGLTVELNLPQPDLKSA